MIIVYSIKWHYTTQYDYIVTIVTYKINLVLKNWYIILIGQSELLNPINLLASAAWWPLCELIAGTRATVPQMSEATSVTALPELEAPTVR